MMQPVVNGIVEYTYQNKIEKIPFQAETVGHGKFLSVESAMEKKGDGYRFTLTLSPTAEITIREINFIPELLLSRDEKIFLNGYQSWTDTKEFDRHDIMKGPSKLFAPLTEKYKVTRYGDYEFQPYTGKRGDFHGASYGYIRDTGARVRFFGSLDEKTGFTFFHANLNKKTMLVRKDCKDLAISGNYPAFNILFSEGTVDEVMDGYFAAMNIKARPARPCTGWTSWYNYYQNISEKIILENLASYRNQKIPIDIFQIDDGYQTAVGDWLSITERFPNGMKAIAEKIKEAGYKPGIWLAPFAGETKSLLFREHRDWFIKDEDGEPFCTGGNWSAFYSLDIYNDGVRSYIARVFDVVLNDWGFDLVKLDFLYGACIKGRRDKTRGQIMSDAMDFLRGCVGKKEILGCGVPLWSAFGMVEYCRIGTDIDLQWHNKFYGKIIHREFPSTKYALQNSVFRRHLDGRAFVNDPDVFLLRHTNIKLTGAQKKTVFYINNLFGNLLFTSDNIREYTDGERKLYLSSFPLTAKKILSVNFDRELYTVLFSIGNLEYFFVSNHGEKERRSRLPDSLYYRAGSEKNDDNNWFAPSAELTMPPFTAECFLKCTPAVPWTVAGSTMSAFPGSEIRSVSFDGNHISVISGGSIPSDGNVCITVPKDCKTVPAGKTNLPVLHASTDGIELFYIEVPSAQISGII